METIQFNNPTGMLAAVKNGTKTQECMKLNKLQKGCKVACDNTGTTFSDLKEIRFGLARGERCSHLKWADGSFSFLTPKVLMTDDWTDADTAILFSEADFEDWKTVNLYHVGDVLAVAEPYGNYWKNGKEMPLQLVSNATEAWGTEAFIGDPKKFPVELAETFVKITGITVKKPRDFTGQQFRAEGFKVLNGSLDRGTEPTRNSFINLARAVLNAYYQENIFDSEMLVLSFVLCDREGRVLE